MTTIVSCPFCGNDDVEIDEVGIGEFAVDCPECRCIGPISDTIIEAIRAWNGGIIRTPISNSQKLLGIDIGIQDPVSLPLHEQKRST